MTAPLPKMTARTGTVLESGTFGDYLEASALFSVERKAPMVPGPRYRYALDRVWNEKQPVMLWVMLNPSSAGAHQDDPTIRKVVKFAKTYGMGGLRVVNLFSLIATDPKDLPPSDANSTTLGEYANVLPTLDAASARGVLTVVAWGAHRLAAVRAKVWSGFLGDVWCLNRNQDGSPVHPLYQPDVTSLKRWTPPAD